MADRKYYVLCDSNCKFESMTKEQIITAIAEATGNTPTDIDAAFITKIKDQNKNSDMRFWVGTQAEYNAVVAKGMKDPNTIYCISTDGGVVLNYSNSSAENVEGIVITNITNHNQADDAHNGVLAKAPVIYTSVIDAEWTADATNGGYYKTVTVDGILSTDTPIVDVVLGNDIDANALYIEAWALVTHITTSENAITLWANSIAPSSAFTIQMKVVR